MNTERPDLDRIAAEVNACQRCPLARTRTRAVPGEGPDDAEIMLIGEGPGYHEDQQGRPFVGKSGKFVEQLLASINLTREQVFIANVIKCRPPNNRDPLPMEMDACTPYLQQQIEFINPLLIVTLGRFSMGQFFSADARITRIHGEPLRQEGHIILPMFHPAAALRNPQWQKAMYEDAAQIPALIETVRQIRAQHAEEVNDDLEQLSLF